jgi:integrase
MLEVNPIAKLHLFNEDNKVEHYLDDAQREKLLEVLTSNLQFPTCQVALFLISTGARLNEAVQAKWCHVDRENRVWRVPASNSKSKRIRSIPLNDSALDLLSKLDTEGKFEYLFINQETGKPPAYVHKYWQRVRKDANLPACLSTVAGVCLKFSTFLGTPTRRSPSAMPTSRRSHYRMQPTAHQS